MKQNHNSEKEEKKKGKRPWLLGVGLRQGRGLGGWWGLCLGPTGPEKALGGWGVRVRLTVARGAQECLGPQRAEDQVQDPGRLPGHQWVGEILGMSP